MNLFSLLKKPPVCRLLIVGDILDASYFVLLNYSLLRLQKENFLVFKTFIGNENSEELIRTAKKNKTNVVIFIRSTFSSSENIVHKLNQLGIKTAYLIDDDFFSMAESLGSLLGKHSNPKALKNRQALLTQVDEVWISTENLCRNLVNRFPAKIKKTVSPLFPVYLGNISQVKVSTDKIFGYMGSKGHNKDLEMIAPIIEKILENDSTIGFQTFGTIEMPKNLKRFKDRVRHFPPTKNYESFISFLPSLKWRAGLAPLENSQFNNSKTFIKFNEYTSAGIPIIASSSPVYSLVEDEKNGFLCDLDQWEDRILKTINDPEFGKSLIKNAKITAESYNIESQKLRIQGYLLNILFSK